MKHGLVLVDKQPGCTSHDVVQQVRRVLGQKKVGHCGTLDPDATGLLVLTAGSATRLTRFLIRAPKVYEGTIRFGTETDTYDASGQVTEVAPTEAMAALDDVRVAAAMKGFEGVIDHLAPPYSAKKHKGVKNYELARRGEETPRETKQVTVYEFVPLGELTGGALDFRLGCQSGTYARTLAYDLGRVLGTGAHLARLRRTRVGPFALSQAIEIDGLATALEAEDDTPGWVPFDSIPLPFAEVTADPQQERRIDHGQTLLVRGLEGEEGDWVKLVDRRQRFLAVGSVVERIGERGVAVIQPRIVFK